MRIGGLGSLLPAEMGELAAGKGPALSEGDHGRSHWEVSRVIRSGS
jgi:hypothetical protein